MGRSFMCMGNSRRKEEGVTVESTARSGSGGCSSTNEIRLSSAIVQPANNNAEIVEMKAEIERLTKTNGALEQKLVAAVNKTNDAAAERAAAEDAKQAAAREIAVADKEKAAADAAAVRPVVTFDTSYGSFDAELYLDKVPRTVSNFVDLAQSGFYDGLHVHGLHSYKPTEVNRGAVPWGVEFGCPRSRNPSVTRRLGCPASLPSGPPAGSSFPMLSAACTSAVARYVRGRTGNVEDEFLHNDANELGTLSMVTDPERLGPDGEWMHAADTLRSAFVINVMNNLHRDHFEHLRGTGMGGWVEQGPPEGDLFKYLNTHAVPRGQNERSQRHVVFGRVIRGIKVVQEMAAAPVRLSYMKCPAGQNEKIDCSPASPIQFRNVEVRGGAHIVSKAMYQQLEMEREATAEADAAWKAKVADETRSEALHSIWVDAQKVAGPEKATDKPMTTLQFSAAERKMGQEVKDSFLETAFYGFDQVKRGPIPEVTDKWIAWERGKTNVCQIVAKAVLKWVANSLAPVRANDPATTVLDWTSVKEIRDSHVAMLATALSTNTCVRTIDLSGNSKITDCGMKPLQAILPRTAVESVATFDYRPNAMVPCGITAPVQRALETACKRVEETEAVDGRGKEEALAQAINLLEANGYTVSRTDSQP